MDSHQEIPTASSSNDSPAGPVMNTQKIGWDSPSLTVDPDWMHLEGKPLAIFLQIQHPHRWQIYHAFVRLSPADRRKTIPQESSRMNLQWDNSTMNRPHDPDMAVNWYCQVMPADPEALEKTGTDFCVRMWKHNKENEVVNVEFLDNIPTDMLPKAYVQIYVYEKLSRRTVKETQEFVTSKLGRARKAIFGS